jgi:CxxC motif-containing protein
MTCIQCPRGCQLVVEVKSGKVASVTGNGCDLGPAWAKQEVEDPVRTLTTSVRVLRGAEELVSVRTEGPIPRRLLADAMAVARELRIEAPVALGRVVAENLAGTGVRLISTRNVPRASSQGMP